MYLTYEFMFGERDNYDIFGLSTLRYPHLPPTGCTEDTRTLAKAHVSNDRIYSRNFRTCAAVSDERRRDSCCKRVPRGRIVCVQQAKRRKFNEAASISRGDDMPNL